MFITLTIDTTSKKRPVKIARRKLNSTNGSPRSGWQKIAAFSRSLKSGQYKLNGQTVMF